MRSLAKLVLVLLLAGGGFGVWLNGYLPEWSQTPHVMTLPAIVKLSKGVRLADFANDLKQNDIVSNGLWFRIWVRLHGDYSKFQAGQYRFEGSLTPQAVIDTITSGKIYEPFETQFVIPEGFTLKQVIDRMHANGLGTKADLWAVAKDKELLKKYNIKGDTVEGFLFPATYSFEKKPTALAAFEKMLQTFFSSIPAGLELKLQAVGLDLRKAVVFASLIEKETLHDDEMPKVSEVIWNRLNANEALGIDAALIYGIQNYNGDITWKHLKDEKNPYNTRLHRGLPPGPIGAISMKSLEAILTPTKEGYRFYVLKNDGSSYHNFSRTLAEHNRFVKELLQTSQKN